MWQFDRQIQFFAAIRERKESGLRTAGRTENQAV